MPRRRKNSPLQQAVDADAVAANVRVSTEDQARSGLCLVAQRTRCAAMAMVKDWPEPVFYADEGMSGTKGPKLRPALAQLLADAKAGMYRAGSSRRWIGWGARRCWCSSWWTSSGPAA